MQIQLRLDRSTVVVQLDDNATSRALAAMLPLKLSLEDYGGGVEKIAYLPGKLPTSDAPSGYKPERGDIAYYAPWGNLAIFRKGFSYSRGLVRIGRVREGFEALDVDGPMAVAASGP